MRRGPFGVIGRALVGAGRRYWWVAAASLGFLPAVLLSNVLLGWVTAADWSCSRIEFGAAGGRYGGCSVIAGELIAVVAVAWVVPLLVLLALLYLVGRGRRGEDGRRVRPSVTEGNGTMLDLTALFVRAVAVLVGLANVLAIGDPADVVGAAEDRSPALALGNGLTAVLAGLVASEVVLRIGRPALGGNFFSRYGISILGMSLGGAVLGGATWVLGGFFSLGPVIQEGPEGGIPFAAYALVAYGSVAAVAGGVLGFLEGLILGPPLAAILGRLQRISGGPGRGTHLPSAVLMGLVAVAALASYAAAPPNAETAGLADTPPLSCPEYLREEIASITGPGDGTTSVFETTGRV